MIFCQGWLWMKTPSEPECVRKWIVLCVPTLQVYSDQDEQGIPEITVELSTVTNYSEVPTDSKYGFEIQWSGPTLTLSAVTQGIRSNWLQALKKAAPLPEDKQIVTVESPISPSTPRSVLASSDEEYRTASEGGKHIVCLLCFLEPKLIFIFFYLSTYIMAYISICFL